MAVPAQHVQAGLREYGALLTAKGLGTGRRIYGWYSDPEIELCDAICVRCGTPGLTW